MNKYMRSRHVPLKTGESKAVKEEIEEFSVETKEAGEILQHYRESKGWSESELGKKVGLDASHITLIEKGEQPASVSEAKKFGKLFHVDHHLFL